MRALRYARIAGVRPSRLQAFIQGRGGLNGCVDLHDQLMDPEEEPPDWPADL